MVAEGPLRRQGGRRISETRKQYQQVNKELWLRWAELIDSYRIFPRLVLMGYAWYVWSVTFFILRWYSQQPATARGTEESAVVIAVVTAVTGFAPWVLKIYVENGRNWDTGPPMVTSSQITSTKTVQPAP